MALVCTDIAARGAGLGNFTFADVKSAICNVPSARPGVDFPAVDWVVQADFAGHPVVSDWVVQTRRQTALIPWTPTSTVRDPQAHCI